MLYKSFWKVYNVYEHVISYFYKYIQTLVQKGFKVILVIIWGEKPFHLRQRTKVAFVSGYQNLFQGMTFQGMHRIGRG